MKLINLVSNHFIPGYSLNACNTALPKKSEMAVRGPKMSDGINYKVIGLSKQLTQNILFSSEYSIYEKPYNIGEQAGAELGLSSG